MIPAAARRYQHSPMPLYAVGDVQGCYDALRRLLDRLRFDPAGDRLWFVGDLINRGPHSAEVLRLVRDLGPRATVVLGNHDLHGLAVAGGHRPLRPQDTFDALLAATDGEELLCWLRQQPLLVFDRERNTALVHAGIHPHWSLRQALTRAAEVEAVLRSDHAGEFLAAMYGNEPGAWDDALPPADRLRLTTNVLTRMRFIAPDGALDFSHAGPPGTAPAPFAPWFRVPRRSDPELRIVFGHWSALGALADPRHIALDTGCVWDGRLSAVALDGPGNPIISVSCAGARGC